MSMAKLQQMPMITQQLLRMVVRLLEGEKPLFQQWGRDHARDLMRMRKRGIPQEEGELELIEWADGEIRFWKKSEDRSVGSGVCLDGSMPRWPRE